MNRKKHLILKIFLLIIFSSPLMAAKEIRLGIVDFSSISTTAAYKNLGIGSSQMYVTGLSKIKGIIIVNRSEMKKVLKEIEIGQTGLIDEKTAAKAGNMLGANYLLLGSLKEVAGQISLDIRLVDVSSNSIVFADRQKGSIADYFNIIEKSEESVVKKIETMKAISLKRGKIYKPKMNSLIALSDGIKAEDEGDKEKAKMQYKKAIKDDPNFELAAIFLSKLGGATAKFKVLPVHYISLNNPAYLGKANKDRLYSAVILQNIINQQVAWQIDQYGEGSFEQLSSYIYGYQFPITRRLGAGLEYNRVSAEDRLLFGEVEDPNDPNHSPVDLLGYAIGMHHNYINIFMLNSGFVINKNFGIGIGISYLNKKYDFGRQEVMGGEYISYTKNSFGGEVGFYINNNDNTIIFDLLAAYNNDTNNIMNLPADIDYSNRASKGDEVFYTTLSVPIYIENTLTFAFNNQNTFLVFKNINELYLSKGYYMIKGVSAVEHWFLDSNLLDASLRVGVEIPYINYGEKSIGFGYTIGSTLSFKISKSTLDIDVNFSKRHRPSRLSEGTIYEEYILFISASYNGIFKK